MLREAGGTLLNEAADLYEHGNFEVHFVAGDDDRLRAGRPNLNRDKKAETIIWGSVGNSSSDPVYLNADFEAGDRVYAAAYEALIHVASSNRSQTATIEWASDGTALLSRNRAIFRALAGHLQQAAPAAAYYLFVHRGLAAPGVGRGAFVEADLTARICSAGC